MLDLINMMIMSMTSFFLFINNPLILVICLIIISLLISLHMYMFSFLSWFSYIMILIYLGGMLVLFSYISNLASNEFMIFSLSPFLLFFLFLGIFFSMKNESNFTFFMSQLYEKSEVSLMNFNDNDFKLSLMFSKENSQILIMMVSFLLFLLLVVMKIINIDEGPLRCN